MDKDKRIHPPFMFTVRWHLAAKNLVFSYDVTAVNDVEARKLTESMLVESLRAMLGEGEVSHGDTLPMYAEITSHGKPGEKEVW